MGCTSLLSLATVSEALEDTDSEWEALQDTDIDQTSEELLYSINDNVTQINTIVTFSVVIGFALLIVYIIIKPFFYFFK